MLRRLHGTAAPVDGAARGADGRAEADRAGLPRSRQRGVRSRSNVVDRHRSPLRVARRRHAVGARSRGCVRHRRARTAAARETAGPGRTIRGVLGAGRASAAAQRRARVRRPAMHVRGVPRMGARAAPGRGPGGAAPRRGAAGGLAPDSSRRVAGRARPSRFSDGSRRRAGRPHPAGVARTRERIRAARLSVGPHASVRAVAGRARAPRRRAGRPPGADRADEGRVPGAPRASRPATRTPCSPR